MGSQAKRWCFTIHEPHYDDDLLSRLQANSNYTHLVYQEEKAPTTGKLHIQGYISFKTKIRQKQVKEHLHKTAHVEIAKGTDKENLEYCTKSETATGAHKYQYGNFSKRGNQGGRTELEDISDAIKGGMSMEDLTDDYMPLLIKYNSGIQKTIQLWRDKNAPETRNVTTIVLAGPSGIGKSYWARKFAKERELTLYSKPITTENGVQWMDGYSNEDILVLDDFARGQIGYRTLLTFLDPYKLRVQVKGGMVVARWSWVIFTSNDTPNEWYHGNEEYLEPLLRRLPNIYKGKKGERATHHYPTSTLFRGLDAILGGDRDGKEPSDESGADRPAGAGPAPYSAQAHEAERGNDDDEPINLCDVQSQGEAEDEAMERPSSRVRRESRSGGIEEGGQAFEQEAGGMGRYGGLPYVIREAQRQDCQVHPAQDSEWIGSMYRHDD